MLFKLPSWRRGNLAEKPIDGGKKKIVVEDGERINKPGGNGVGRRAKRGAPTCIGFLNPFPLIAVSGIGPKRRNSNKAKDGLSGPPSLHLRAVLPRNDTGLQTRGKFVIPGQV